MLALTGSFDTLFVSNLTHVPWAVPEVTEEERLL